MKKYIDQAEMRRSNTADIFGIVRKYGKLTRRQVEERSNMSWGTVSIITSQLIEDGYLIEKKAESDGGAGRRPSYLEVNCGVHFSIGIDINTLGAKAVLMNLKREIVSFWEGALDLASQETFFASLFDFIDRIMADVGTLHIMCIGIAMQGIVNSKKGISVSIPGHENWETVPLAETLESKYGIPIFVEHDPNCILYAASKQQNIGDTLLLRADHGIGMAVMIGGKMVDKQGIFEISHSVVDPGGLPCGCGKRGCLAQYSSTGGIAKSYGKSFDTFIADVESGNEQAREILTRAINYLALAIVNAACLMNIENVILCGSLWNHKELFWNDFMKSVDEYRGNSYISFTFTGVSSAPIGAALIAEKAVLRRIDTSKD